MISVPSPSLADTAGQDQTLPTKMESTLDPSLASGFPKCSHRPCRPTTAPTDTDGDPDPETAVEGGMDLEEPKMCWRCIGRQTVFIFLCISAQWMAQAQLGMVIIPLYEVGQSVGTTDPGQLSWMAAAYGYVLCT